MQRVLDNRRSPLVAPDNSRTERFSLLDRVRGTAIFGVLFVNLLVFVADAAAGRPRGRLDRAVAQMRETLFDGKIYPIFALVFGYTLAVQMRGAGRVAERRSVVKRRLVLLAVLGAAHALTLYRFDILFAYALLGALTFYLRHTSTRALMAISAVLVGGGGWIVAISDLDASHLGLGRVGYTEATATYRFGTFPDLVRLHLHNHLFNITTEAIRQWPFVLAMMIVGIVAERFDIATRLLRDRTLVRRLLALGAAALAVNAAIDVHSIGDGRPWLAWIAAAAVPLQSIGYIAAIARFNTRTGADAAGRMSLTVYLAQSAICATALDGFGLGLGRFFTPTVQLLFAIAVYSAQCRVCRWWLARHERGPVESLVHNVAATGMRTQPRRSRAAVTS